MKEEGSYIQNDDIFSNIDIGKIIHIFKRSILWVVLVLLITNSAAYLYLRYTKPVYESESIIKLEVQSEASILGISNPALNPNISGLSGEIELIRSKLFLSRVAEAIDYNVAYYYYGRYLTDERYKNSPFAVSFKIHDGSMYDRPINIEILNDKSFLLSYSFGGAELTSEYKFGQEIKEVPFNLLIEKTKNFSPTNGVGKYYFIINSQPSVIAYLKSNVKVTPENFNAKTIKISLRDHNRAKARDFVNAIDTLYLFYTKEVTNQALEQKIAFLNKLTEQTETRLENFEDYFEDFTITNRTTSLSKDLNETIGLLEALDSQRFQIKTNLTNIDIIEGQLKKEGQLYFNPFVARQLPSIIYTGLEEYAKLQQARELKLSSYNENTFVVKRIDQELDEVRQNVFELVAEYKTLLGDNLAELDSRKRMLEGNFAKLPSMGTEYNKNRRIYSLQEEFWLSLRQSKMELEITRAGTVNKSVILASASIPNEPVHPKKFMIHAVGLVVGLVISLLIVGIKFILHNKITSMKELDHLVKVPILGGIPIFNGKLDIAKLVIDENPRSAVSEAMRSIRTNMQFLNGQEENKVLAVTSTVSGEGKTFVGVNMAAIMALSGQSVCIVDLDMRKPKVNQAFDQEEMGEKGVSTILINKYDFRECIKETRLPTLFYIPAGPTPPNPSELLLTKEFDRLLEGLREEFDTIILDTPPVGLVTDGILVMKNADLQLYVMRAEFSKRDYVTTLNDLKKLNQLKNLTVILNSLPRRNGRGYGYGYNGDGYYDEIKPQNKFHSLIKFFTW